MTIFGTNSFDVGDIDPGTLKLCLEDLSDCTGVPVDWSFADRGEPGDAGAAQCALVEDPPGSGNYVEQDYLNPDGFLDMDVAFDAGEVQAMLGVFCGGPKGGVSPTLVIVGETFSGVPIQSAPVGDPGIDQLLKANI